jgi:outer membrane protein
LGPFVLQEEALSLAKIGSGCVLVLVSLFAVSPVPAQTAPAAAGKIGVVNIQGAIAATAEGKQAANELQSQFAARQQELQSLNKQMNDLQQRLSNGISLSDEERNRLQAQGTRLSQRLERKNSEMQDDYNAAQSELINGIGQKMIAVINRYAQEHGLSLVVNSSAQGTPILYASKNIEITQEIVNLYDQTYPAKAGAAAPAPKSATPAPKPATPPVKPR